MKNISLIALLAVATMTLVACGTKTIEDDSVVATGTTGVVVEEVEVAVMTGDEDMMVEEVAVMTGDM